MLRWLFRLVLTLIAARLLLLVTRRLRARTTPQTPSFDPGLSPRRAKSPRAEALSPHPIEDAEYEELPRSSG